jgi:hypothetical protein
MLPTTSSALKKKEGELSMENPPSIFD